MVYIIHVVLIHPPFRSARPVTSKFSVEDERKHQENWLQLIEKHRVETVNSGGAASVMWAAYYDSRCNGVGDRIKCIETWCRDETTDNWSLFLADSCNKIELFRYLSTSIEQEVVVGNKNLYVTAGQIVRKLGNGRDMPERNHEESDTRVIVHLAHALEDSSTAIIFTCDTDVIIILLANFHHFLLINPHAQIWVYVKAGKTTKMISMNRLARKLGTITCKGLALFHSLTG